MKYVLALLAMLAVSTSSNAAVICIDDFGDPTQEVFVFGGLGTSFDESSGTSPLGGSRGIRAEITAGSGAQVNLTGTSSEGKLDLSTSVAADGLSVTTWDGLDDDSADSEMLMADFTGNDRFRFDVTAFQEAVDDGFASLAMKVTDSDSDDMDWAADMSASGTGKASGMPRERAWDESSESSDGVFTFTAPSGGKKRTAGGSVPRAKKRVK